MVKVGVDRHKKPKDLSTNESEERGHGEGVGVYTTLIQSDTLKSNGTSGWVYYHSIKQTLNRRLICVWANDVQPP